MMKGGNMATVPAGRGAIGGGVDGGLAGGGADGRGDEADGEQALVARPSAIRARQDEGHRLQDFGARRRRAGDADPRQVQYVRARGAGRARSTRARGSTSRCSARRARSARRRSTSAASTPSTSRSSQFRRAPTSSCWPRR